MSTLVEIEQAIDRLPDWDVDQLVGWRRAGRRSPRDPKRRAGVGQELSIDI